MLVVTAATMIIIFAVVAVDVAGLAVVAVAVAAAAAAAVDVAAPCWRYCWCFGCFWW